MPFVPSPRFPVLAALAFVLSTLLWMAPAIAFTARVCNTGDTELRLSVAGQNGLGGWYTEGWFPVQPGRCWSRGSSWEYQFLFTFRYLDAAGNMGYGAYQPKQEWGKYQFAKTSNRKLCVDMAKPFRNVGSLSKLAVCKPGQEQVPFAIQVSGDSNDQYTLNIPTRAAALHGGAAPQKKVPQSPLSDRLSEACWNDKVAACMVVAQRGTREARWAYPRACALGNAAGCLAAARALRDGPNGQLERKQLSALRLFAKGCVLGNATACKEGADRLGRPSGKKPPDPILTMLALGCDHEAKGGIGRQLCWSLLDRLDVPSPVGLPMTEAEVRTFVNGLRQALCAAPQDGEACPDRK